MNKITRMKELIAELNNAANAYYNTEKPIMSDAEFDSKLEDLRSLEEETNITMANSPTQKVGTEVLDSIAKVVHKTPMLSLNKCHSVEEIEKFANYRPLVASIKLDGLSCRLIYENGELVRAESRGNGIEGNDITQAVKQFQNVPLHINKEGTYVIDGEALITLDDFAEINKDGQFKNSRNLAAGTLSSLDTSVVKDRRLSWFAWEVVENDSADETNLSFHNQLAEASELGFDVVPFFDVVSFENVHMDYQVVIDKMLDIAEQECLPQDGVVFKFDDVQYGKSLGNTSHHFRNGIAFKVKNDSVETTLKNIEYTIGKTGVLTPTAVFEPVEIEGTTVERATLHNISIMKELLGNPWIGQKIGVFKANLIVPAIRWGEIDNHTTKRQYIPIPTHCPICHQPTTIKKDNDSEVLICTNEYCEGKLLKRLSHAVSKNALNIENLSEASLKRFIQLGYIKSIKDIYHLEDFKEQIQSLEGFGQKSVEKLLSAIQKSRNTTLAQFLYSLSIPLLGKSASKDISKVCENDFNIFVNVLSNKERKAFTHIDGIGIELAMSMTDYWNKYNLDILDLANEFIFEKEKENSTVDTLQGKSFCITGKLISYSNRAELVKEIESHGGKVVSSVTKKTDYLINNDTESVSSKNKTAKSLGIPIISEVKFKQMIEGEK